MEPIVVFGAGGHAKVAAQTIRRLPGWELVGFIDEMHPHRAGEAYEGATVLGGRSAMGPLLAAGVRSNGHRIRKQPRAA